MIQSYLPPTAINGGLAPVDQSQNLTREDGRQRSVSHGGRGGKGAVRSSPERMAWGPWRSCRALWWGRGGGARSGGEGGQAELAEKEDGLGQRKMAEKDGLGRRHGERGEDGLGAVVRQTW
jgi:hypothetical protein